MKELTIFTGAFGSGKTEISINFAIQLGKGEKVALVDLDIVNSYFRSRTKREVMEEEGVTVVAPEGGLSYVDIPIVLPSVKGYIENREYKVVVDVGGEKVGAKVLGSLKPSIETRDYDFFFVVNTYRPFTSTEEEILAMAKEIEVASRLRFSGIIANPNLGHETKVEDILKGFETIREASFKMGLPVKFLVVKDSLYDDIIKKDLNVSVFPIKRYLSLPFLEY